MKNAIIILFALSLIACSKERTIVSGTLKNADTLALYLEEVDVYDTRPVDSIMLKSGGNFRFALRTGSPGFYQLRLSNGQIIVLFPKPGQQIHIEADTRNLMSSIQIDGSTDTEQILKVIRNLNKTRSQLDSISLLFSQTTEDTEKERLNEEYETIVESHRKFSVAFILTHYNSFASLYVLYQQYQPGSYVFYRNTDIQYFKIVSDSLKKYYPDARHVIALEAFTNNLIARYNSSLIMRMAEGSEPALPEVALPGLSGDTITLKSLQNRYVLLHFWASWNQESLDMNSQLIRIYNNFKDKGFEVMAVSLDNSIDSWTRAIKFDELYWINVIDQKFPNSIVAANYNVTALPCTYLVDKDDVSILAKNLTPAQLQERLNKLLN